MTNLTNPEVLRRWRLMLGKDSEDIISLNTGTNLVDLDAARDKALDYLYQREYDQRGLSEDRSGSNDGTEITPALWLQGVRKIFPKTTIEVLQKQAIDRYQLLSLLTDVDVLQKASANLGLVQTLLSYRNHLSPDVMVEVRRIIRTVCEELEEALAQKVRARFSSRRLRHLYGGRSQLSNLDWNMSIRRNLKNYNVENDFLILQQLYFNQRQDKKIPWDLYLVIDQSGSMVSSIVHSAVLAAIFCSIAALNTHLILFDTSIVDLSGEINDPVETLLSVQLGGGTNIGKAMGYVADKIAQPHRSIVILISDFYEGVSVQPLYKHVEGMKESGVTMLGLAALNDQADPDYDEATARQLVKRGMDVGAMTPDRLAAWVASKVGS
jgi:hypothetical protein